MRKLLLALPLASLLMLAGCSTADDDYSSAGFTSPSTAATVSAQPQQAQQQAQAQPAQQSAYTGRSSTTQPLPSGYGYIHEQDLTGGRLTTAQSAARPGGI